MSDLVPEGVLLRMDSDEMSIVQEVTMSIGNLVARLAEEELFGHRLREMCKEGTERRSK